MQQVLSAKYENDMISQLPEGYFSSEGFRSRVFNWCSMCGIRDLPDEFNMVWLEETLGNELAGYSLQEIDVALKMNVMGEFDPPVEAYNMFNIKFLAGVMKHYKKFRIQADKEYTELRYKTEKPPQIDLSPAQKDLIFAEGILNDFKNMLDGYELFGLATKYDFLVRIGAVKVSPDSFERMVNRAKEVIERQATTSTNKTQRNWLRSRMKDPDSLRLTTEITAKEMIVSELFNQYTRVSPSLDVMYEEFMLFLRHHLLVAHPHLTPLLSSPKEAGEE